MTADRVTHMEPAESRAQKQSELIIPEHVRMARDADGATILDILHGKMFRVNFVGSKIIELLQQCRSETEIADCLAQEFAIDKRVLEGDQHEFLLMLEQHGLVSRPEHHPLA